MTHQIKSIATVFSAAGCAPLWKIFLLMTAALTLSTARSFAQAQGTNLPATPTPQVTPLVPAQETTPSPVPTPELSPSAPTQETVSSPSTLKKLSLEQLMDLDVTSVSKQPEPYGQAPAAIDVITNDEIRRSGASSIPEALRLADNLQVAQKDSHDWAISARGFNTDLANKLLVLMDGRTVYTPLFSGVIWDVQDYLLEDLDRIEVISGPGGTLWGANAVNGVINIISKSAKDTQGLYVEGGGGTQLQDFTGVRYGGTLASNIYYRFYGKYYDEGNEDFTNGDPAPDSSHMGQGGFRMDALASADETFTLQGDYYDGDQNIPTGGDSKATGGNVLGRWSRNFADDSSLSLQLYFDQTYLNDPIPSDVTAAGVTLAPAGPLEDTLDTYDLDFQYRFHLNDWNNLILGLGYRFTHDVDQEAPALAFGPSPFDQGLYSGFAQDEMTLAKDLSFIFGSKLEHNDYTGFEVEPSARLKWDMTPGQMIWAAVSRAVRMPSRVDRDEQDPTPNLPPVFGVHDVLIGGSDFLSENVIAYELGYRAQLDKRVSGSLSLFYNQYDDIRSTSLGAPAGPFKLDFPFVFANNLEAQTGGAELTVDYQVLEGWRMHAGYDLLQENVWVKPGGTDINNALNETADPPNQVFVRSSMDLPGNLEFDPSFRWIDSLVYNNNGTPARVPSYAELDVRLGWHPIPILEISVTGQSLLEDQHVEYLVSGANQNEEISRSVYGKAALTF
jgi:iron complex outermembrane receptor protein